MASYDQVRICPHCQCAGSAHSGQCWICGESLPPVGQAPLAASGAAALPTAADRAVLGAACSDAAEMYSAAAAANEEGGWTFSLGTLFLVMTLAAVCAGVIGYAPDCGVPVAIVVTLALGRSYAVSRRQGGQAGLSPREKIAAFASSVGITIGILFVAQLTMAIALLFFYVGPLVLFYGSIFGIDLNWVAWGSLILSGLLSIAVTVKLFRATWPEWRVPRELCGADRRGR